MAATKPPVTVTIPKIHYSRSTARRLAICSHLFITLPLREPASLNATPAPPEYCAKSAALPAAARHSASDLWDLWALSELGAIDRQAADLYRRHGPTNQPPTPWLFTSAPTDAEWHAQLAGQTRITVSASAALDAVQKAWRAAVETLDELQGRGPLPYKG